MAGDFVMTSGRVRTNLPGLLPNLTPRPRPNQAYNCNRNTLITETNCVWPCAFEFWVGRPFMNRALNEESEEVLLLCSQKNWTPGKQPGHLRTAPFSLSTHSAAHDGPREACLRHVLRLLVSALVAIPSACKII